jgi:hypothetical protein
LFKGGDVLELYTGFSVLLNKGIKFVLLVIHRMEPKIYINSFHHFLFFYSTHHAYGMIAQNDHFSLEKKRARNHSKYYVRISARKPREFPSPTRKENKGMN